MKNRFGVDVRKGRGVTANLARGGQITGIVTRVFTENGQKRFELDDGISFALDDAVRSEVSHPVKSRKKNPQPLDPGIMVENRMSSHDRAILHAVAWSKNEPGPVFVMDYGGPSPYYLTRDPDLQSGIPAIYRVFLNGKAVDHEEITITAPKKKRGRNPATRRTAAKSYPIATGKFRVFFLNHDYFSQSEFDHAADALAFAKSKGFEAVIYDPAGNPFMSWSPVGGTRSMNPISEPDPGAVIYWAQTVGRPPLMLSPHFSTKTEAKKYAAVLGRGTGAAVAVMRGTHDDYQANAGRK